MIAFTRAAPSEAAARQAANAVVEVSARGKTVDARSVTALMTLGVRHGDALIFSATGSEADAAIASLLAALAEAKRLEDNTEASTASPGPSP